MATTTGKIDFLTTIRDVIHHCFFQIELLTILVKISNFQLGATI